VSDVWYFAYGSNLDPATFLTRRGMRPVTAHVAHLAGHRLVFDLPVGPGERAVANVVVEAGALVHGVAYHLTSADADQLDRTEGVHLGVYRRLPVVAETANGPLEPAFTYDSPRGVMGRKPSERYLGLILRGARHHGLPLEWIEWLDSLERAVDERLAGNGSGT
jgi:cation transport regulator ChaC